MSISSEIERIELGKSGINDHLQTLGLDRGQTINDIAQNITVLQRPTGRAGQFVGFVDDDVIGAVNSPSSGGESIKVAYIVGDTPFANDWLSLSEGGEALTPVNNGVYAVMTEGNYCRCMYLWNGTEYTPVGDKYNLYAYDDIVHNVPDASTGSGDRSELYRITPSEHTSNIQLYLDYNTSSSYGGGFKYGFEDSLKVVQNGRGQRTYNVPVTAEDIGKDFIIKSDNGSFCTLTITNCTITETSDSYHTTEYIGARSSEDGKSGLVPPATSSEKDYILFGDGTWKDPNTSFSIQDMVNVATSNMQGEINSFQLSIARNGVVGEITAWLGAEESVPQNYLVCKGQTLNRLDYPQLYNVLYTLPVETRALWGGADWIDTFNLPDLRGEFLRGTGYNSHTNQGNGADVGVHQDGTEHSGVYTLEDSSYYFVASFKTDEYKNTPSGKKAFRANNIDSEIEKDDAIGRYVGTSSGTRAYLNSYTSRPTNTSVLYIIRYKADEASITQYITPLAYSTEEQRVGTWIDGKPLYQKYIEVPSKGTKWTAVYSEENIAIVDVPYMQIYWNDSTTEWMPMPYYDGASAYALYVIYGNELRARTTKNGDSFPIRAVVRYTKTTD